MKQVVESYVVLWVIMFMFFFAFAFTSINLNVAQARKIVNDIKTEVQASNGALVCYDKNNDKVISEDEKYFEATFTTDKDGEFEVTDEMSLTKGNKYALGNLKLKYVQKFKDASNIIDKTLEDDGYTFEYRISTEALLNQDFKGSSKETYIYNNIYKIEFYYYYNVPLFGTQCYPIVTFAY